MTDEIDIKLNEMMTDTTREKIKQVLGTMVDRNRYVFWYDEGGQMKNLADSIDEPGICVLHLDGNPFSTKYEIEKGEQPERGFVIYSTETMLEDEDNWLLDYQEEGDLFLSRHGFALCRRMPHSTGTERKGDRQAPQLLQDR